MKWLRKILIASFRWLATLIELTASPYERPMNRRQRRQAEWEKNHKFSAYWRDVPWYKINQYYGGWQKIESELCKPKKPETLFTFGRYRVQTRYQVFISTLIPYGYVVQKRNWRWKWTDVAYFPHRCDAELYILNQEE